MLHEPRAKALPVLGYTHFQPAQPTTLGKRACLWINDLVSDIRECEHLAASHLPLGCKGTTGTQASFLDLFRGDYESVRKLDDLIVRKMGFTASQPNISIFVYGHNFLMLIIPKIIYKN